MARVVLPGSGDPSCLAYREGFVPGGTNNGGSDDGNGEVSTFFYQQVLAHGLGVRVGVGVRTYQL